MREVADFIRKTAWARTALAGPIAARRALINYKQGPLMAAMGRLEELLVSDVRIRIDEFDGEFVVGPRSHLLHRILANGQYEPKVVAFFLDRLEKDRDVIDVGANIGMFTVLASKHLNTGKVLAIEPTSAAFHRLCENVSFNNVSDKVVFYNGLAADKEMVSSIHIVEGREEYSSMGDVVHPSVKDEDTAIEEIPAKSIDQLVKEFDLNPALIKVDVEGAEGMVFTGAEETLRAHRPVVISEFTPTLLRQNGSSAETVLKIFDRCNYDVHDLHNPKVTPGSADFRDIVAIPR